MSQVSRRSEVRNHKRRILNTLLSSDTSAFAVSVGTYLNYHAEAGTKKDNDVFPFEHSVGKWVLTFQTWAYDI